MEIISRFFQPPEQSFFLFGPRGTGKTTWLEHHMKDAIRIDLLMPIEFRRFAAKPERLIQVVKAAPSTKCIIIDEIQKVPDLLDVVHLLIERNPHLQFVLTGSSSRKLKRSGVDLLAGRAVLKSMHPFMASELGNLFDLDPALRFGMLPLVMASEDPQETIDAYISLYLKEEVQTEGLTRNIGAFSRFLEAASFSHANVLNVTQVARECRIKRKTVTGYFTILEDLLLAFRLPVFSKRAKRNLIAHPKFYFFDAGVFRSLRPTGYLDNAYEMEGAGLEGLVAQHLRAWAAYRREKTSLYYWRTKSGVEVDLVLYGPDTFCGMEVKNSKRVDSRSLRGLIAFKQDYPEASVFLLYRGKERLMIKGILCIPCESFLKGLTPFRPIRF